MPNILNQNGCIKAPGLAIGSGGKTTFSYGNTFYVKANGYLSDAISAADAPALTTAKNKAGETPGNLAAGYCRAYTLLASVNKDDGTVTMSLAASEDYDKDHVFTMDELNWGNAADNDSHKAVVGFCIIRNATNPFVPGTTALDATGVTVRYFDHVLPIGA